MPTWNIRNIILGLRSMFTEETPNAIGSIVCDKKVRAQLAEKSKSYSCKECGCVHADLNLHEEEPKTES